jgi:hypothetical protein
MDGLRHLMASHRHAGLGQTLAMHKFKPPAAGAVQALVRALFARLDWELFELADLGNAVLEYCDASLKALNLQHLTRNHSTAQSEQSNHHQAHNQLL